METENRVNCHVCGGFDFMKENGFFYCTECQTQCEGIREQVFEEQGENDEEILIGTPFDFKKRKKAKKIKNNKGEDFTSWEMLNFVLLGLTQELISYGAPKSIRDTVLQMWAFYLQNLEIAFFSKEEMALPKLGLRYHSRDAMHVYKLKEKKPVKWSNLLNASMVGEVSSICDPGDWCSQKIQKKIKNKAKKAFMGKMAELSMAEYEDNESSHISLDQSSVCDSSVFDDSSSVFSMTLPAEEESVIPAQIVQSKDVVAYLAGEAQHEGGANPLFLTRFKLVVLLYLALLYEGSTIYLSDILRWIREGHLSYYEAAKHLPENCFVQGRYRLLFKLEEQSPTYGTMLQTTNAMAKYLKVSNWPLPSASVIAKKYVRELQLPDMFSELVEKFVALVPLAYNKAMLVDTQKMRQKGNYEGSILAIIIIILKLLFGLDGRTEHQISKAASQLNILLKQKKNRETTKLFVWKDWVQQLICRRALLNVYHFPTKHHLYPEAYGNPYSYINFCDDWRDDNAGFEVKYNKIFDRLLRVHEPALLNTLTSVLEKLQDSASLKKDHIKFPRSDTPYSLYIQKIIEKSAESDTPLISKPALDVLTPDFSKCDITYLLQPKSMVNLAAVHGQQLKVKKKSAQKKFKTVVFVKPKKGYIESKEFTRSVYVAVTNCDKHNLVPKKSRPGEILELNKKRMKKQRTLKKKSIKKNQKKAKRNKSEKVKKSSRKKKDREKTKSSNAKHSSCLHDTSRKRRKEELPSRNSKKIKLSKLLKLYVPFSKYWVYPIEMVSNKVFNSEILPKFPFSFAWLLSECAFLSEMTQLDLYSEVVRIEGHLPYIFK